MSQDSANAVENVGTESIATAIIYLRVSSSGQVNRGTDPEGYSIPGQREATSLRCEHLGATIAREYVEYGVSGKTTKRPALQQLLADLPSLRPTSHRRIADGISSAGRSCSATSASLRPTGRPSTLTDVLRNRPESRHGSRRSRNHVRRGCYNHVHRQSGIGRNGAAFTAATFTSCMRVACSSRLRTHPNGPPTARCAGADAPPPTAQPQENRIRKEVTTESDHEIA